ncbi:apolipoprotein N-acyltransferase [Amycolatopsis alkalitolerans]|uniref:Apolipoprotein N-acyltransferase n=1 Tax=Amycolatopsis alkalitolerans TaxID=2547244 RepID=A0A5C4M180_9PSEU|nr:apolipoprotein N-acyltransferase [Amycolatopsis alkalitolerans]TNC23498.1 apolipoprotein N-acyltransferase [Amycolatopsis alkalitolerans]
MAVTAPETSATSVTERRRRAWRPWLLRLTLTIASGFVFYLSFAPRPLWWLAPIGFAGLAVALRGRRLWGGLGYGFAFGLAFNLPLLLWLQDFLGAQFGPWPWLGLAVALAAYLGVGGALCTLVARLPWSPVWMSMIIIATETPRAWFPFGGFPWGRVAFSQPEGAFLPLASIGGAPLVGFAVVLTGFAVPSLVSRLRHREWRRAFLPAGGVVLPVVAGLALWPTVGTAAETGSLTVATVQGDAPNVGIALMDEQDTLRANHLAQSERLTQEIRSGAVPKPDLVVWPESVTDLQGPDPVLDKTVADLGAPTLVGTVYRHAGETQNSVFVWDPRTGRGEDYSKQQLVPFSEHVPARALAQLVTPFVNGFYDMTPGSRPAVLDVAGTKVATPICYEIAYDYVVRDGVDHGGQLIVLPTNTAWFGESEMSYQQLAIARLRAVEHSRAVVVSATSGVSAIVEPDGTIMRSTSEFTAASLVGRVPLRDTTTLSDRLGAWTEYGLISVAVAAVLAGLVLRWRTRRAGAKETRATGAG